MTPRRLLLPMVGSAVALALGAPAHVQPHSVGAPADAAAGAALFAQNCAGCHGAAREGGRGPALTATALRRHGDGDIAGIVLHGIAGTEMPAFKGVLNAAAINDLVAYLHQAPAAAPAAYVDPDVRRTIHSQRIDFRIEVVADGLDTPWGLAFLPGGRMLVTERSGILRLIDSAHRSTKVADTPRVWVRQDAGLLDVAVDPDYRRNRWVYLSYAEVVPGHPLTPEEVAAPEPGKPAVSPPSMTVIERGRIDARGRWTDRRVLFRGAPSLYTSNGSHYGSRFAFDRAGHLFFSLGERGDPANGQRLDTPLGKVHRIFTDGRVPPDNPFVARADAVPTIWSYGHRNPQGFAFDPRTGLLWETEHGPNGGDEINIVERGHDYGWGVTTMGRQAGLVNTPVAGMDQPVAFYVPSVAPSGITFYDGTRYPGWRGNLFVSGLTGQALRRVVVDGRRIVEQEVLFERLGRVRTVVTGPDGLLYVLLQQATGKGTPRGLTDPTPGMVVRLVPVARRG